MTSKNIPTIKFSRNDAKGFFKILNKRVNQYFKEHNISKTGNWKLYVKTFIMFSIYMVPYFLMLTIEMNQWLQLGLTVLIGIGMAGVGMNVMHDGNHGSYSKHSWVNKLMGSSIYILAGNVYNWKVQHNVLHHTYTNIQGHDEDLDAGRILRFSKNAPWKRFHKFQHYYSIFIYGLLTLNWVLTADYTQMKRYIKRKLNGKVGPLKPVKEWSTLVFTKMLYVSIWIVLPMIFIDVAWWKILIGFFVMHYTAGLILSLIFQLAHITEDVVMPLPDNTGTYEKYVGYSPTVYHCKFFYQK
jgi:linoleoyl-CoA desaturase